MSILAWLEHRALVALPFSSPLRSPRWLPQHGESCAEILPPGKSFVSVPTLKTNTRSGTLLPLKVELDLFLVFLMMAA